MTRMDVNLPDYGATVTAEENSQGPWILFAEHQKQVDKLWDDIKAQVRTIDNMDMEALKLKEKYSILEKRLDEKTKELYYLSSAFNKVKNKSEILLTALVMIINWIKWTDCKDLSSVIEKMVLLASQAVRDVLTISLSITEEENKCIKAI